MSSIFQQHLEQFEEEEQQKLNEREVWKTLIEVLIKLDELEERVLYLEWKNTEKEVNAKLRRDENG